MEFIEDITFAEFSLHPDHTRCAGSGFRQLSLQRQKNTFPDRNTSCQPAVGYRFSVHDNLERKLILLFRPFVIAERDRFAELFTTVIVMPFFREGVDLPRDIHQQRGIYRLQFATRQCYFSPVIQAEYEQVGLPLKPAPVAGSKCGQRTTPALHLPAGAPFPRDHASGNSPTSK